MPDHKSSPTPAPLTPPPGPVPGLHTTPALARRIPPELRLAAVERLVTAPDRTRAARSLIESAHQHAIDLDLLWGAVHHPNHPGRPPVVSQTCLAVPTAGRTAMLFLSAPDARFGPPAAQRAELAETLRLTLRELPGAAKTPLVLAQTLLETHHDWAEAACRDAGLTWVGRLHFMRLPWPVRFPPDPTPWPDDITVAPITNPLDFAPAGDGAALAHALEATYADTLDCPELCGLRHTRDVITSHMATGEFDPKRWWIIRRNGIPEGCCLLNHCPANRAVELVYLGISPRLRGRRLAQRLLTHALTRIDAPDAREITCAVDTRNTPAVKLYHAMGFRNFGSRTRFVMPLAGAQIEPKPPLPAPTPPTPGGQSGSFGTSGGQENIASAKRL
jgi:mycothiol synthase